MSDPSPTPDTAQVPAVTGKFGVHHDHLVFMGDDCNCDTPDPALYGHRAGCGDVPVMTIDELTTVLAHAGLIISLAARSVAGTAAPDEHRETELWQVLDWSLWGNGLGDRLREAIADTTLAALTDEQCETAERCIKAWHERRGPSMAVGAGTALQKERDTLDDEVLRLREQAGEMAEELDRLRQETAAGSGTAALTDEKDPEVGDPVFVSGCITAISEGVATVEVYRSWPLRQTVDVQCGALEHDDRAADADGGATEAGDDGE